MVGLLTQECLYLYIKRRHSPYDATYWFVDYCVEAYSLIVSMLDFLFTYWEN